MAEWLRRGLQILARRFDSGSGLHLFCDCELAPQALVRSCRIAALAQSVEHIIRNDGVTCSSHVSGTTRLTRGAEVRALGRDARLTLVLLASSLGLLEDWALAASA